MKDVLRWVKIIYRPVKRQVLGVFLFIIVIQALGLLFPYIYGKLIDALAGRLEWSTVILLIGAAFVVHITKGVVLMYWRESFELEHLDFDVPRHNTKVTLEKLLSFSIGQLKNEHSGIRQSVIKRGEHSLTSFTYMVLYDVVPMTVQVSITLGMLLWANMTLGLVALSGVACFSGVVVFLLWSMRGDLKILQDVEDKNEKAYTEILRNLELIKVHAQEVRAAEENDARFGQFADLATRIWKRYVRIAAARNFIAAASVFTLILIGARAVLRGEYTVGYLTMIVSWGWNVFDRLGSMGHIQKQLMQMYVGIKKYFVLMSVEPDIKMIENPVCPALLVGDIEFRHLSFTYPVRSYCTDGEGMKEAPVLQPALRNIDLSIRSGERVAFVGHSGSGKTTLISLLLRAYDPTEGSIRIDGVDLRDLDLTHYREQIGTVEQDVALIDDSIRSNIMFGLNGRRGDMTERELREVTQMSCLDNLLARCEHGLSTEIGERGIKISGGERQRIGIARAIIKMPRILIFDEATSHLDAENEALIRNAIRAVSEGRTTIIIAHRLSTVRDVDRIFVLDDGRLVGQGKHDELLGSCEPYRRLIESQVI